MNDNWPFADSKSASVFSTKEIIEGKKPILYVSHDTGDGAWQFHSGAAVSLQQAQIVPLEKIVALDPTVKELADLPFGWEATRENVSKSWERSEM